jgi:hypothetical protein
MERAVQVVGALPVRATRSVRAEDVVVREHVMVTERRDGCGVAANRARIPPSSVWGNTTPTLIGHHPRTRAHKRSPAKRSDATSATPSIPARRGGAQGWVHLVPVVLIVVSAVADEGELTQCVPS